MGSGRGWLADNWPSTGGVLNITAAVWAAGFHWWRSGNKKRTQNVSEYMLVFALCLVAFVTFVAVIKSHSCERRFCYGLALLYQVSRVNERGLPYFIPYLGWQLAFK